MKVFYLFILSLMAAKLTALDQSNHKQFIISPKQVVLIRGISHWAANWGSPYESEDTRKERLDDTEFRLQNRAEHICNSVGVVLIQRNKKDEGDLFAISLLCINTTNNPILLAKSQSDTHDIDGLVIYKIDPVELSYRLK